MSIGYTRKLGQGYQYLFSIGTVIVVSLLCYIFSSVLDYRVVAYILLITVSIVAMLLDIMPVLAAATLSALVWDFFFIEPHYTLQVNSTEDAMLLLMYFIIALLHGVLTYQLRKMQKVSIQKEEKEGTLRLYNTLLNSLSHEMRTPIATIIAATDNLQGAGGKMTDHDKYELVNEIAKASFRLNQQVENLLNMSRLESGFIKPQKDWCDINELVYDTVQRIEENNIAQKITINVNPNLPLYKTDRGMLEQVLYNLLNNAVQYTPQDARIDVVAVNHADVLELTIQDNGPGFPPGEVDKVFDKFYRLKQSRAGGTGLGLSIVKGFTEALGGSLSLQNKYPGGATFIIELPAETSYLKNLKNE